MSESPKPTEKLIIDNFVGIKHLELDIRQINILIGPQATGKSICAKLLFYFKRFPQEIMNNLSAVRSEIELGRLCIAKFDEYFPPRSLGRHPFTIRYEVGDYFTELKGRPETSTRLGIESSLLKMLGENFQAPPSGRRAQGLPPGLDLPASRSEVMLDYLKTRVFTRAGYDQVFIPAGRSFLVNLRSAVFSLMEAKVPIDPFMKHLGAYYEWFRGLYLKQPPEEINLGIEDILRGHYVGADDEDIIETKDGRRVDSMHWSSAQQEVLPLAIILAAIPFAGSLGGGFTLYVEEPEAHLFPLAQKEIVELLATAVKTTRAPQSVQYFITTHSPYVLTSFNKGN